MRLSQLPKPLELTSRYHHTARDLRATSVHRIARIAISGRRSFSFRGNVLDATRPTPRNVYSPLKRVIVF